jgi:hypothetical protein
MKRLFVIAVFLLAVCSANAQGYTQAAGIRASWVSPGLEYRYYTSDKHSLRALLAFRDRGIHLHTLTEFYQYDLFAFSYQLVFFYGAGLHAGFESYDKITEVNDSQVFDTRTSFTGGIDGVVGLEYVFYDAPVKVGVEVKPYLDIFGHDGLKINPYDFALTVKYLF